MAQRLDLDYCPVCDMPTFDHEVVATVGTAFYHYHCFTKSVCVASQQQLYGPPKTN